jgi:hypothetical protein
MLLDELLMLTQAIVNNIFKILFGNPTKHSTFVFLIVTVFHLSLSSQEKIGLTVSNYGGVYSNQLNPAAAINSKVFFDFNLLGASTFIENNFLFIHKKDYRLFSFLSRNPDIPVYDEPGSGLDYTASGDAVQVYERVDLMGPSFSYSFGKHSVGFTSKVLAVTSVTDLPRNIAVLMYEGLEFDSLYGIDQNHGAFDFSTMGWWEVGGNYAYIFKKQQRKVWSAGINVRALFGYAGTSVQARSLDYTLVNDSTIDIRNLDADIGFSIPVDLDDNEYPDDGAKFKGKGIAVDLGVMYVRKRELPTRSEPKKYCAYEHEDYIYKIGFSVLDLGAMNFKENAQQHTYDNVGAYWDDIDTVGFGSINELTKKFSSVFYGDPNASLQSNSFKLGLPTRLSLQADYQYFPNWYLNTVFVLPVKLSDNQLRRPSQAIFSLRYETSRLEVNVPLSLYDLRKPRLGLFVRFYFISIGTEKLGGLFSFQDFTGLDLYVSVKYHFEKGRCARYKHSSNCRHMAF